MKFQFEIASYCSVISSWVNGSLAVTHDPWPTDPIPALNRLSCIIVQLLQIVSIID